jgi:hypothetical protein
MKIEYISKTFSREHRAIIAQANEIITEYEAQGYDLTLRQIYYQFVARDLLSNTQQSYKRLGGIISDARLAGELSWDAITDRTRNVKGAAGWTSPESIIDAVAEQYRRKMWDNQPNYVEVWVEKEALANVVERAADEFNVPWFCCRGYVSQSEMHSAAMRLERRIKAGQAVTVIHLGDHDPSGIDMTRDIEDRIGLFVTGDEHWRLDGESGVAIERIALNRDQIRRYRPPPNPAKTTDARYLGYEREHGDQSWELDALEPSVLTALISDTIRPLIDFGLWNARKAEEQTERQALRLLSMNWNDVQRSLLDE